MIASTDPLHVRRPRKHAIDHGAGQSRGRLWAGRGAPAPAAILLAFRKTGQRLASILTRGALARSDEAKKGTILMTRFGRR
jgi:hypothetical protein